MKRRTDRWFDFSIKILYNYNIKKIIVVYKFLESNSNTGEEEEQDEDEPEDEDIEFYNYMSGDIYYEDDKNFVFPRIKVK